MSKDYHGEVARFSELSVFRSTAKQSKVAEQWKGTHWVRKVESSR